MKIWNYSCLFYGKIVLRFLFPKMLARDLESVADIYTKLTLVMESMTPSLPWVEIGNLERYINIGLGCMGGSALSYFTVLLEEENSSSIKASKPLMTQKITSKPFIYFFLLLFLNIHFNVWRLEFTLRKKIFFL